jgi:very-short-patch-repair endonuclease
MPNVQCEVCGNHFEKSNTRIKKCTRHFCSTNCLYASRAHPIETKNCEYCQKPFETTYSKRTRKYCDIYCAKLHRSQLATVLLTCEHCGKSFERRRRVMSPNNYCSLKCANLVKKEQVIERACGTCGKTITVHPSLLRDVNYCSKPCLGKALRRRVTCTCKNCGIEFEKTNSDLKYPNGGSFCSQSCTCIYTLTHSRSKRTNIELAIEAVLIELGVAYVAQRRIAKFVCDFYVNAHRLVIECDGIYWHSRPEQKEKDNYKDSWLISRSFKVLRLTDKEILGDIERCKERILEAMKRKGTHEQLPLLRFN